MLVKRFKFSSLITLALLFTGLVASAQPGKTDFNRPQTYDVQHYVLRVGFDRAAKKVLGDTTVRLKPLKPGFNTVELDAVGLNFEAVLLEPSGAPLKFSAGADKVAVTLDRSYSPSDEIALRFKYTTVPKKGIYFVGERREGEQLIHGPQVWTQGEPEEARHWFPSFDFPSDKATTEQIITAPKGETVIGNGLLTDRTENSDGTATYHYRMPIPHSTYLVSFVVGTYEKIADKYKNVELGYYVYPGGEYIVPLAYGKTKDMLRAFEELTNLEYPFNKYDQTIVSGFTFGGMENITATTMADTEIMLAGFDFARGPVEDLVSHELAHSWFGNLVTMKNWSELWLNEGFATYLEAASREKLYGREDYIRKIRSDADQFIADDAVNKRRHGLVNKIAKPDDSLFDVTTYQKGGAVLHTLREEIGTEAFWKGANVYLNRHKFGNVETSDLKKAMEEASGKDLTWFFDQWVYGAGHPKLDIRQTYSPSSKTLKLTIAQTQKADGITPQTFILPASVSYKIAGKVILQPIRITKRVETFTFKAGARPSDVELDPDSKVPVKTVTMKPLVVAK